jgi:hypothetical protein
MVVIVLVLLVLPPIAYYAGNQRMSEGTSTVAGGALAVGIVVTAGQLLGTFNRLNVAWPESVDGMFGSFQIFLFDPDVLGLECVMGNSGTAVFPLKCMSPFMMIATILLYWVASRALVAFKMESWALNKTLNCIGIFLQVAFIAIIGMIAVPFQCYSHPNGQSSVASYPQILCGSSEHSSLVALAMVLLMVIVIPFAALNAWITLKVRAWSSAEGGDLAALIRFRYLFFRFRPDVWWWGNVYNVRQLLLAFSPMVQPDDPASQVIFITVVLVFYLGIVCAWMPWKAREINFLDAVSVFLLALTAVQVTSFMEPAPGAKAHQSVMWAFIGFIFVSCIGMMIYTAIDLALKGKRGMYGLRYPRGKTMQVFANEWAVLCQTYARGSEQDIVEWLERMNDYDRMSVDAVVSLSQSYGFMGARRTYSGATVPRLVLDVSGPPVSAGEAVYEKSRKIVEV